MTLRMTEEEFAAWQAKRNRAVTCAPAKPSGVTLDGGPGSPEDGKRRSKYGNVRTEIDGIVFDSKHEAEVWRELMLRVKAGELRCVLRQVKFDLPGGIRYVADFVAIAPDMTIEGVYDAKSEATKKNRVYINKKKQLKALWGIEIREV